MPERRFNGVYSVLATPFATDGTVDFPGLGKIVDLQLAAGVAGVVCFGLASEVYKLSDGERREILSFVVERVDGRVEVVAGTEHTGFDAAVVRSVEAVELGASALMLMPPSFVRPGPDQLVGYYEGVAAAVAVPVVVQDAPAWTGVELRVDVLARLAAANPRAAFVKVEAPPTAAKIAALEAEGVECIGGFAGLYLLEELERGVTATMPGCAYAGAYVEVLRLWSTGERAQAAELGRRLLPLSVWSIASLDTFIAVQKRLLHRAGVIDGEHVRLPAAHVDASSLAFIERLIDAAVIERFLPSR